jgi:ABC-type multidrug transport system fused ATPase/permease subunit
MTNIAIKVENLAKRYRIGLAEEQHDTLFGAMKSWLTSPVSNYRTRRRLTTFEDERRMTNDERHSLNGHSSLITHHSSLITHPSSPPADIIWALKDVSFEACPERSRRVKHGEVVGIPSAALSTSLKTRLRTGIGRNGAGKSTLASTGSAQGSRSSPASPSRPTAG